MDTFKDVLLTFNGASFVLPAAGLLRVIARLEDVISLGDLSSPKPPLAKISQAYGIALRAAGAEVSDEDVYIQMFGGAAQINAGEAVSGLLMMMIPPDAITKMVAQQNKSAPKKKPAARKSRVLSKS